MLWFRRKTESDEFYAFFKKVLGYRPRHTELYHMALLHKSHSTVIKGHRLNNERLEYLGDSVLSTVVADHLYRKFPYKGEGPLTILRSRIVSRASLNDLAVRTGLIELVVYDTTQNGQFKSMGGNAFEALIGAIFLERGYNFTRKVIVERLLRVYMDIDAMADTDWNYKGLLIDWAQKRHQRLRFELVRTYTQGRDRRKRYECRVVLNEQPMLTGTDFTIKGAEQQAAELTYKQLTANGNTHTKQ